MDEYYNKYARPLGKLNIFEVKQNLSTWRDGLREELECLIYLRNGLNLDSFNKIELKVKNKLLDITNKLENIALKEIECISEFVYEIDRTAVHEVDDKIFTKLEFIRDNYNKILLNIQKMISSSPILLEMREKFDSSKSSLIEVLRDREKFEQGGTGKAFTENVNQNKKSKNNYDMPKSISNSNVSTIKNFNNVNSNHNDGKEWLDKLTNDVENLNREQSLTMNKRQKRESQNSTANKTHKKEKSDYTVDKDLDHIIENFQKNIADKKYKSAEKLNDQNKGKPVKKSKNVIITESSVNNPMTLQTKTSNGKVTYESIKNLNEEIDHIKKFCQDLKKSHEENCIMENEKKNFDKMKSEHIKLHADMNILKEDVKEILTNYQYLMKRVTLLEEENKNLRQHNKHLVKFINNPNYMNNHSNYPPNNYTNNYSNSNVNVVDEEEAQYNIRNIKNNINVDYSTPLSELSAFNTGQSSVEMLNNINQNSEKRTNKRRFLIPKSEDPQNNYY